MAPAEHGTVHQDAEGAAHAAATLGDRVEDRVMRRRNLLAPRNGLDARRAAAGARRHGRRGTGNDGQLFGRHAGRDVEGVQDSGERLVAADPHRQLHQPLGTMGAEELAEHLGLDAIGLDELPDVLDDAHLGARHSDQASPIAHDVDGRRGHAGLSRERHVRVPDVSAVLLPRRRADRELGVRRLDDALPVEIFADLVPRPGEARTVQHDRGRAADAAAERGEVVEERVVLGSEVVPVDDELHPRHGSSIVFARPVRPRQRPGPDLSGRDVAPHHVAAVRAPLQPLVDHPLRLRGNQIVQRVAPDVAEAVGGEEPLDLFA